MKTLLWFPLTPFICWYSSMFNVYEIFTGRYYISMMANVSMFGQIDRGHWNFELCQNYFPKCCNFSVVVLLDAVINPVCCMRWWDGSVWRWNHVRGNRIRLSDSWHISNSRLIDSLTREPQNRQRNHKKRHLRCSRLWMSTKCHE